MLFRSVSIAVLERVTAEFSQGNKVIYAGGNVNALTGYLTVTAYYSDGTSKIVTDYTLSGELVAVRSTITVEVEGMTATFDVNVTAVVLDRITVNVTDDSSVYPNSDIESLRSRITVTAHYNDGSETTVNKYSLYGKLETGLSTITVDFNGKTAKFAVRVSEYALDHITAIFRPVDENGDRVVFTGATSLDDLKRYLEVTAYGKDEDGNDIFIETVENYILSGDLTSGVCTVTVSYNGKTASFDVDVTEVQLAGITAEFNQNGVIYDDATLDDLYSYLTVEASYRVGGEIVTKPLTSSEYVLEGDLGAGGAVEIKVSYGGFEVYVTVEVTPIVLEDLTVNFNQGSTRIFGTNKLDDLRPLLEVFATYTDGTQTRVYDYVLKCVLSAGRPVDITVEYGGKTAQF